MARKEFVDLVDGGDTGIRGSPDFIWVEDTRGSPYFIDVVEDTRGSPVDLVDGDDVDTRGSAHLACADNEDTEGSTNLVGVCEEDTRDSAVDSERAGDTRGSGDEDTRFSPVNFAGDDVANVRDSEESALAGAEDNRGSVNLKGAGKDTRGSIDLASAGDVDTRESSDLIIADTRGSDLAHTSDATDVRGSFDLTYRSCILSAADN